MHPEAYFIFAGFNALPGAEQRIIKYLIDKKQADFIIDTDSYYYDNKFHEAGHFQRKNSEFFKLKPPAQRSNALLQEAYNVKVIECAQHIGQVKVLATELLENPVTDWSEVLVLLADESLVHAAIRNIPKTVGQANITLGLPLDQTPIITYDNETEIVKEQVPAQKSLSEEKFYQFEEIRDRTVRDIVSRVYTIANITIPTGGLPGDILYTFDPLEIGRASCRERV